MEEFEKPVVNQRILIKLSNKIYSLEYLNDKTRKFSDSEMSTKVRKVIDEMVRSEVGE